MRIRHWRWYLQILLVATLLCYCVGAVAPTALARDGVKTLPADELWTREEINQRVIEYFSTDNFAALEELASKFRLEKSRTASGLWASTIYFSTFRQLQSIERWSGGLGEVSERFESWSAAYPTSPTPRIARAWFMYQLGWVALINENIPDAADIADRALDEAWSILVECRELATAEPEWYVVATRVMTARKENTKENSIVLFEGIEKFPNYYELYFAGLEFAWMDRWADKQVLENFARMAVENTESDEGMSLYARLYWYAAERAGGLGVFHDRWPDWPSMKAGIHDVVARYPDNWNLNNLARYACAAGDYDEAVSLIERIQWPLMEVWGSYKMLSYCRDEVRR